jgi:hypothetical protein
MVVTGSREVEAGDGETRTCTPGSVLVVTDGDGRGHKTRVVGAQEVLLVWGPIPSLTTSLHTSCGTSVT